MSLIVNGSELTGAYNISYNGTTLKQIDVIQDSERYTVWRKGNLVLQLDDATTEVLYIKKNGTTIVTIPSGTSGELSFEDLGLVSGDTITLCKNRSATLSGTGMPNWSTVNYVLYSYTLTTNSVALKISQEQLTSVFRLSFTTDGGNASTVTRSFVSGEETHYEAYPIIVANSNGMSNSKAMYYFIASILKMDGTADTPTYKYEIGPSGSVTWSANTTKAYCDTPYSGGSGKAWIDGTRYDNPTTFNKTVNYVHYTVEEL